MGKGVVSTTTLIECSGFSPHPVHDIVSLDKTLYDDYISAWWLRKATNSADKNSKKFTGTLDHRKLLSRSGFLQSRSSPDNEKCVDRPTSLRLTLSGNWRINMCYNNNNKFNTSTSSLPIVWSCIYSALEYVGPNTRDFKGGESSSQFQ